MIIRFFAIAAIFTTQICQSHDYSTSRPDSHAPITIMGDHTHTKGEWMLSYRAMFMDMKGNLDGTQRVSTNDIFANGYMMAPEKMQMIMHMFGLMYASSDQVTWMLMLPYLDNTMDMVMKHSMGAGMPAMLHKHDSESSGLGDTKVSALINIWENSSNRIHISLGLSLPTGSINEKNNNQKRLPYPMQLGSGTWDLLPGITWNKQLTAFSYGMQFTSIIRTGQNRHDYRLGNQYALNSWIARPFNPFLSASLSLNYDYTANIHGKDKALNTMQTPSARTDLRAGQTIQAGIGLNVRLPAGNRLAFEYQVPVYQNLDGPQMALNHTMTLGWQLTL